MRKRLVYLRKILLGIVIFYLNFNYLKIRYIKIVYRFQLNI